MSDQVVPNTEDRHNAALAVAWEIVRLTTLAERADNVDEKRIKLTNSVIEVYEAILKHQPIKDNNAE